MSQLPAQLDSGNPDVATEHMPESGRSQQWCNFVPVLARTRPNSRKILWTRLALRQLAVVVRVAFATQRCMINKLSEQCTAIAHAKIAGNNPERTKAGCTASLRTLLKRSAKKLHAV